MKTWQCLNCGKEHKGSSRKFCSNKCQGELKNRSTIEEWLANPGPLLPKSAKPYLIAIRGNNCEICRISEWCNKLLVMDLDHIDGNSENNRPDNLRLLCPNCHSQTPTFKSKNRGNGKRKR